MNIPLMNLSTFLRLILLVVGFSSSITSAQTSNPDFVYFSGGDTTDSWHWVLGDNDNWWTPLEGNEGKSAGGKVKIASAGSEQFPGAVKLTWGKGDKWGNVTISGRMADLSRFEHSAELVVALKVESRVPASVKLSMSCGENCSAEVDVADNLKQMARGQWMALPVALDCFAANGLDLSKVSWPFSIGTSGALVLDIVEISLAPMKAEDEGCVPNAEAAPAVE